MALRLEELAKTLDHALLDPSATADELERLCAASREHHVAPVCVPAAWVGRAAGALRGSDVKVAALVAAPGTPHALAVVRDHPNARRRP
jgi:deoxyribose-phosphate aldolase